MSAEADFIASLRDLATDPGARGLLDDVAVLELGGHKLVLTHDMIVEGIHYRPDDPAEAVAWKLVAVNLSDLAGKGARPIGILLGFALGDSTWDKAFIAGLRTALGAFALPLLGGDTVSMPAGAPRALGLTAIGTAAGPVPSRGGARPGDALWVTGSIGDSAAGLDLLDRGEPSPPGLVERYRSPRPRLEAGERLAPLVSAMMDVSDGLLIDSARLGAASHCAVEITLGDVPLSEDFLAVRGGDLPARLFAAAAGDDYELLFAVPADAATVLLALSDELGLPLTRIGQCRPGSGLSLSFDGEPVLLPERLGFEHRR